MNKNSTPVISIIVPVYQVESYIEKCFDSIEQQKFRDFECIFVDDCGKDRSMEILEKLIRNSKNHEQYRIIRHEKNRGLSAARNSGLDAATGTYILFIDSDDYLLPESLSLLTEPLQKKDYDLVIGRYQRIMGDDIQLTPVPEYREETPVMEILYSIRGDLALCAHNRLIKREFMEKHRIRFIEGILWEDNPFSIKLFNRVQTLCYLPEPTYAYIIRKNSICTTYSEKHYNSWVRILNEMEEIMKESTEENRNANIRLLGSFRLRTLILSQRYGIRKQIEFLDLLRQKGYSEEEFQQLEGKQKLLYIQHKMPRFLAKLYVPVFSFFYRLLREW